MSYAVRVLACVAALVLGAMGSAFGQPAPVTVPTAGGDVTVIADRIEDFARDHLVVATGNVEISRGRARLIADRIEINRETGDAVATGRVIFYDGNDRITGDRIDYNIRSGTGVVHQGHAEAAPYYRMSGERMERVSDSVYRIRKGVFTTCEGDSPVWSFHFDTATADLEDYVYGTGASFWVKNVPLIPFFPFFAAAIRRERQTGFLFPTLGSSARKGFYAELPFFWAIDESQDLTVSFNAYEAKGFGGRALYRYRLSENHGGYFGGFYIHESQVDNEDRGWGAFRHEWHDTHGLRVMADVNLVSDDSVLRDYSLRLSERSQQRVDTNVFVTKSFEHWNLVGNIFSYQDLTTARPTELRRLPELRADRIRAPVPGIPNLLFDLESSATYFQRDIGSEGARVDVHPRLSFPMRPGDLFTVTPFLGGRLTGYQTGSVGRRPSGDFVTEIDRVNNDPRLRSLVETGADLEMPLSRVYAFNRWGIDALLHRIEPRVNYTYITGSHFTHLPLFTERIDRIKEASLITYSLTNRILAKTSSGPDGEPVRWEAVRFLLGHSLDLRSENHTIGDVVGDLIVQAPSIFRFRGEIRYSMAERDVASTTTDFTVSTSRVSGSVGTRYDNEQRTNFLQGATRVEITQNLAVRAATNWDMRTDTLVENQFGVDLRFQCWEVSVVFIDRTHEVGRKEADEEVRFSINLLGVGGPLRTAIGP
jgi:LPS-assembly protein